MSSTYNESIEEQALREEARAREGVAEVKAILVSKFKIYTTLNEWERARVAVELLAHLIAAEAKPSAKSKE